MMLHFDQCGNHDTSTLAVADSNDYAGVRARYVSNEVAEDTVSITFDAAHFRRYVMSFYGGGGENI